MQEELKILFVSSEVSPFAKTDRTARIAEELPKVYKEMEQDIRIITPQYRQINERKYVLREVLRLKDIEVKVGSDILTIDVKSAFIPDTSVQVYFVGYEPYFFRQGMYENRETGEDFSDNDKRFLLFNLGIFETLKKLFWQPDIIHCLGWQTALIPLLLHTNYKDDEFFNNIHTHLTLCSLDEGSKFSDRILSIIDPGEKIQEELVSNKNQEFDFLHAGLQFADSIDAINSELAEKVNKFVDKPIRTVSIIGEDGEFASWEKTAEEYITIYKETIAGD